MRQLESLVGDDGRQGPHRRLCVLGPSADKVAGLAAAVEGAMVVARHADACGSSHHGSQWDSMARLAKASDSPNSLVEVVVLHAVAALVPMAVHGHRRAAEDTSCVGGHLVQAACADTPHELAQTLVLEMKLA